MGNNSILNVRLNRCPKCGKGKFKYNTIKEREEQAYVGNEVAKIRKYMCLECGLQLD